MRVAGMRRRQVRRAMPTTHFRRKFEGHPTVLAATAGWLGRTGMVTSSSASRAACPTDEAALKVVQDLLASAIQKTTFYYTFLEICVKYFRICILCGKTKKAVRG